MAAARSDRPAGPGAALSAAARREGAWLIRGLRTPGLWALLIAAGVVWTLAWQTKSVYTVDAGGLEDNAYVAHFYAKEPDPKANPNPPFTYRWSQAASDIVWPGLGNVPVTVTLRLAGGRPVGQPPPVVTATVHGQVFPLPVTNDLRDYSIAVGRGNPWDGDLAIHLHSTTFTPPGDPRALGVLVLGATVTPVDLGLRPGVVPPPADLARWAAALGLLWLLTWRLTGSARAAAWLGAAGTAAVALGAVAARPDLGLLAPEAPVLLLWAVPLALGGLAAARALGVRGGAAARADRPPVFGPAQAVGAAFAAAFVLRFGGMVDPQFLSSDILLHVHNVEKVLSGTWVWTGYLPNNTPQPYPPLPYLAVAPLAWLVPDLSLLIRFAGALLDASLVLAVAYVGALLAGPAAGAAAAWVAALLPASFVYFSPGNYSYLFASAVFGWTLAAWAGLLKAPRPGWARAALLALGFFLTFLSAYGLLIAAVAVGGLFVALALLLGPAALRRRALVVAGAAAAAGLAALAVYYVHFLDILLAPAGGTDTGASLPAAPAAAFLDLLGRRLDPTLGVPAILAAAAGWVGGPARGRALRVLAAALTGAGLVFAALSLAVGENIRYPLLLAPVVAVGAGALLARVGARGGAGRAWSVLFGGALAWHLLTIWIPLVLTRYH